MGRNFIFTILFAILTLGSVEAQETNYIHVSFDAGVVANTSNDNKTGMGGTLAWFTQDNLLSFNPYNYLTLSVKAFNNPYGEGKFISSIMNKINDAFNYIMPLAGYRVTWDGISDGFFIEPRFGAAFSYDYTAFVFSPIAGYAMEHFDFSIYCDMGFGKTEGPILQKNFITPGVSIAYNISLY